MLVQRIGLISHIRFNFDGRLYSKACLVYLLAIRRQNMTLQLEEVWPQLRLFEGNNLCATHPPEWLLLFILSVHWLDEVGFCKTQTSTKDIQEREAHALSRIATKALTQYAVVKNLSPATLPNVPFLEAQIPEVCTTLSPWLLRPSW